MRTIVFQNLEARFKAYDALDGFSCSMDSFTVSDFATKLPQSSELIISAIHSVEHWSEERERLLLDLAEHEVMHEGQIIRHVLGMGKTLPSNWKWA